MEINVDEIVQKLLLELRQESDKMSLRAEGVSLLYGRLKEAAEKQQSSIAPSETAGTQQESP